MEKIRYEIDPQNKLIYYKTRKESKVPEFRYVLDGKFKIDEENCLIYRVKKPQGSDIPQQIKLSSGILSAKDNELAFVVNTKDSNGAAHINILKLSGAWRADKYNRLSFQVTKDSGPPDALTLKGAWEINKQNQIIYSYKKSRLKTKEKESDGITFKGWWDITEKNRISYILNKEINSVFDFKVSFQRPRYNFIRYSLGLGAIPKERKFAISGMWRIDKNLGLLFEIDYERGQTKAIAFGGICNLNKDKTLEFKLKNQKGEGLGIDVKLSKTILKDQGEAFIQALASRKKAEIVSGIGFMW